MDKSLVSCFFDSLYFTGMLRALLECIDIMLNGN